MNDYPFNMSFAPPSPFIGKQSCLDQGLEPTSKVAAYKFMKREDFNHYWEKNNLKIGTLFEYAESDKWQVESSGGVKDAAEIFIEIGECNVSNSSDPKEQRKITNLRNLGLADIRPGVLNTSFGGGKITRKNRFIYCLSHSINKGMFLAWHEKEGYDFIVRINDVLAFVRAVENADKSSKKLLTCGGTGTLDWINYHRLPFDNEELNSVKIDSFGFYKDKNEFQWQDEIRISWGLPNKDTDQSILKTAPYNLNVPNLLDLIEVVDIPRDWLSTKNTKENPA